METFLVKCEWKQFENKMKQVLKSRGMTESNRLPVTFIFVAGEPSYQKNKFDTRNSKWISLLWGDDILTNKIKLHTVFKDSSFLIPSQIIRNEIPEVPKYLKILKPLGGFSGSGIQIVQSRKDIESWIAEHPEYSEWLLQKYVKTPGLLNGYKFHLRVFVLVKTPLEVYVGNLCYYVTAKEKYQQGDWLNADIHDTHYHSTDQSMFPTTLPDGWEPSDGKRGFAKIVTIVRELFKHPIKLRPSWGAQNGFEVFGMDILFDKKKPYLLEFNNKMGYKGDTAQYAEGIVNVVLDGKSEPYFTRVV